MKRNRLVPSSKQANIFSATATRFNKLHRLLALSLLTFAGIFITSMVLATGKPASTGSQSQIIDLPNLSAEKQIVTNVIPTPESVNSTTPDSIQSNKPVTTTEIVETQQVVNSEEIHLIELATIEQQGHGEALPATTLSSQTKTKQVINKVTLSWQEVTVKSGDNLSLIFPRVGLTARDVYNVAQLGKDIKPLLNLKPGQKLRFGSVAENDSKTLHQLQLKLSPIQTLEIISTDNGYQATMLSREVEKRQMHASGTIENSLFEAGIEAGLSDKIVMELAYIFGWDVDFALDLRKKDSFKLIYDEDYLDGDKIADGSILAAEFTNQGKTYRAIRFTDEAGLSRYYAPNGDSMRKTFSRSPVHFSRISSRFNPNRKHPVLKTSRPHRGVDYAAARGTPITATGDGKVDFVGAKGGYGRTVVLSHGGKYTTLYAHMSKYKRGIKRGKRVHQGDVIGYIGSSGLATGPHLHYEFRVSGVHRNPLTVKLPKAEPLPKKYRSEFDQQAQPLLAQLDKTNDTTLALND
ncbi:MAG: peptidase M23 [Gammaproteobacteria bacterium]|nr:MAG: peptidase M23 [Gammaproteobacteria bacterium]RKZ93316.1 MAG: peptidase M23 [Gammaproteobacteria bacterium]RKZ96193.1 MAG: peptidase M23 [Gammaproteobacteria bacterium]